MEKAAQADTVLSLNLHCFYSTQSHQWKRKASYKLYAFQIKVTPTFHS